MDRRMSQQIGYMLAIIAAPSRPGVGWRSPLPPSLQHHFAVLKPAPNHSLLWPPTRNLIATAFDEAWRTAAWKSASTLDSGH